MEEIIKCKRRVQKHGEVFTPKRIVNKMLNIPGVKEACESLTKTFLEPSAGEVAFLTAILERKLNKVKETYNDDLKQFENYSLLALTTLYGVELLEDNVQTCVMNMFQLYYDHYQEQVRYHGGTLNKKVLDSAKEIISANIRQGNFLTRKTIDNQPLVVSEWLPINLKQTSKTIKVQRTEYTLDEIYENVKKESGKTLNKPAEQPIQLDMFDGFAEDIFENEKEMRYVSTNIIDVYQAEMEEVNGSDNH